MPRLERSSPGSVVRAVRQPPRNVERRLSNLLLMTVLVGVPVLAACPSYEFGPAKADVVISNSPGGSFQVEEDGRRIPIDCTEGCRVRSRVGADIFITALPQDGVRFGAWLQGCDGAASGTCRFRMPHEDVSLSAAFLAPLSVHVEGPGEISIDDETCLDSSCQYSRRYGTTAQLRANPWPNAAPAWQGDCLGAEPDACSLAMDQPRDVSVRFACNAGMGDCNGSAEDGCETEILSSREHCGGCGNHCGGNIFCSDGHCCPSGKLWNDAEQACSRTSIDSWRLDGPVNAITISEGIAYLGGDFRYIGLSTGQFASLDRTTGAVEAFAPTITGGAVHAIIDDGRGGFFVGGAFRAVDGAPVRGLVRLAPDGTFDPGFRADVNGTVRALVLHQGRLFVAGTFREVSGSQRTHVAALDPLTGAVLDWSAKVEGFAHAEGGVDAVAASGDSVFLGGFFSKVGGKSRTGLAAVDSNDGEVRDWKADLPDVYFESVRSLAIFEETLFVGGTFSQVAGKPRSNAAAVKLDSGELLDWAPEPNGPVFVLAARGDLVILGGDFTEVGGEARTHLAAVLASSGTPSPWAPKIARSSATGVVTGAPVMTLAIGANTVHVAGTFQAVGVQHRLRVAEIDLETGLPTGWSPGASGNVGAVRVSGDRVLIGGSFDSAGGMNRSRLAAIEVESGRVTPWAPAADGRVSSLTIQGDAVYFGGAFTHVDGISRARAAAVHRSSGALLDWKPDVDRSVDAVVSDGNRVFLGGEFEKVSGQARRGLAVVDADSGNLLPLRFDTDAAVEALAIADGRLFLAGDFKSVDGQRRSKLAAIDLGQGRVSEWNPSIPEYLRWPAIAVGQTEIFYAGREVGDDTVGPSRILVFDPETGARRPWSHTAFGGVNIMAFDGAHVYVGGWFDSMESLPSSRGVRRTGIAALQPTGKDVLDWDPIPGVNPRSILGVRAMGIDGETVIVGGPFWSVPGLEIQGVARFPAPR